MANPEQVALLKQGVAVWNEWRRENPQQEIDLRGAHLEGADLERAGLQEANLEGANILEAKGVVRHRFFRSLLQSGNLIVERFTEDAEPIEHDALNLFIDPGTASPEEIAEFLHELSTLYKMVGGSGLTFRSTNVDTPEVER